MGSTDPTSEGCRAPKTAKGAAENKDCSRLRPLSSPLAPREVSVFAASSENCRILGAAHRKHHT